MMSWMIEYLRSRFVETNEIEKFFSNEYLQNNEHRKNKQFHGINGEYHPHFHFTHDQNYPVSFVYHSLQVSFHSQRICPSFHNHLIDALQRKLKQFSSKECPTVRLYLLQEKYRRMHSHTSMKNNSSEESSSSLIESIFDD